MKFKTQVDIIMPNWINVKPDVPPFSKMADDAILNFTKYVAIWSPGKVGSDNMYENRRNSHHLVEKQQILILKNGKALYN